MRLSAPATKTVGLDCSRLVLPYKHELANLSRLPHKSTMQLFAMRSLRPYSRTLCRPSSSKIVSRRSSRLHLHRRRRCGLKRSCKIICTYKVRLPRSKRCCIICRATGTLSSSNLRLTWTVQSSGSNKCLYCKRSSRSSQPS